MNEIQLTKTAQNSIQKAQNKTTETLKEENNSIFDAENQNTLKEEATILQAIEKLHDAVDGFGTDEEAFKETMDQLDSDTLAKVAEQYEEKYGKSLEEAIKDDFMGFWDDKEDHKNGETWLNKLENARAENENKPAGEKEIEKYVDKLYDAVDGAGTDEEAFKETMDQLDSDTLVKVAEQYEEKYGESLEDAIKGDFMGFLDSKEDHENGETWLKKLENARAENENKPAGEKEIEKYVDELHDALDGFGTDKEAYGETMKQLDGDAIDKVVERYEEKYGESLGDTIISDFMGIWYDKEN